MVKLKIFVADAQDVLRRGLRSLLTSHNGWTVCGESKSGLDAVKLAVQLKADLVILDVELLELNGIEAARQIKQARPSAEILIYTAHNEEYVIAKALLAGARGHVLKSDSEDTLMEAVKTVARHQPFLSNNAAEFLLKELRDGGYRDEITLLSSRERQIVKLLSEGKSNKASADRLQISVKTVEAHRSSIMRKLGFNSITDLVRYAIRNGLIQP